MRCVEVTLTDNKKEPAPIKSSEAEAQRKSGQDISREAKKLPHREKKKESLQKRLKAAEEKAEENYERLLRVTAEFENYKKRTQREMDQLRKFANESLIKDVLLSVDNLERALAISYNNNEDAFKAFREGVEMTLKGLLDTLTRFGVAPVESLGKPFDPNLHHAISQQESDKHPENTVLRELQKGYTLRERLIRPAMVVVSKKPDAKQEGRSKAAEDDPIQKVTIQ